MPTIAGIKLRIRRQLFPQPIDYFLERVHGWTSRAQLEYLMSLVRALPDGSVIVEVGVWHGRSALALGEACRGTRKQVYAIDPWRNYSDDEGGGFDGTKIIAASGLNSFDEVYKTFRHHIRDFDLGQWLVPVRATGVEAARVWAHPAPYLVFIDADHTYESVTGDLEAWTPLIAPGSIICGDDWEFTGDGTFKSVQAAVTDFVTSHPDWHLALPCPNTWELRRA